MHTSCPDDNEAISSTSTSARCSPLWIVHHASRACCPRPLPPHVRPTAQQCLDYCIADSECFAVEWRYSGDYRYSCEMHEHRRYRDRLRWTEDVRYTTFVLNRQCNSTQGITICINNIYIMHVIHMTGFIVITIKNLSV